MPATLHQRLSWLAGFSLLAGCSTAQFHPELVASAAKVRVVRDSSAVAGCKFLSAVSATEEAGYDQGIFYDPGTPAITLLQIRAHSHGADTVEITSSDQSYRAGRVRARTLTTLTGNAYLCLPAPVAGPVSATSPASATDRPPVSEKGNATIRIRLKLWFLPDGGTRGVADEDSLWLTVDADIEGNRVLAYYDFTSQDARISLESCWLDASSAGQCRQREADGTIGLLDVDGRNLRAGKVP